MEGTTHSSLRGVNAHDPLALELPATSNEVARFVAIRAAACVGAGYSNLALLDSRSTSLRLFHHESLGSLMADRYSAIPIDAAFPICAAVRLGRTILLPDLESYKERFPAIVADTVAAGVQASASLPLFRADGGRLGAIGFAWTTPISFDQRLEAAMQAVAQLCVGTIERAERYDTDHAFMNELQDRLLGELPNLPGVEIGARYLPASSDSVVGGDWYEGLVLGRSKIAVVVGDVAGHGVAAAADMALIRGIITALLYSGVAPTQVFGEVSGVLLQRKALLLATATLAVVDVADESVTIATAGHPPPLLRLPDGRVRVLDVAKGPMIGVSTKSGVAEIAEFPLGSQLILFTDGLVERHDQPFDDGISRAVDFLSGLVRPLSPVQLIDALMDTLVTGTTVADDIAVLVVEHSTTFDRA
jgi:serine phosphatase RsbU (regulator of sigma subunit)